MHKPSSNFFGLDVTLTTSNSFFNELFLAKFGAFSDKATEHLQSGTVQIDFNQDASQPQFEWLQIDSQIKVANSKPVIQKEHYYLGQAFLITLGFDTKKQSHTISIQEKASLVFATLNLFSRGLLKRQLYQNILKLYIEQPLYHFMCTKNDLYCLHASGVGKKEQGLLFYGLNGVGKSTLAQYLITKHGYDQVSDNYTLVSDSKMYASPENVRLASDSLSQLGAAATSSFGFEKMNISSKQSSQTQYPLSTIVFLSRGEKFSCTEISKTKFESLLRLQEINGEDAQSSVLATVEYFAHKTHFSVKNAKYVQLVLSNYADLEKAAHELHH